MSVKLYGTSGKIASQAVIDLGERQGGLLVANTAVITGKFSMLYALAATVVATMTTDNDGLIQSWQDTDKIVTAFPIPVGGWIKGNITSFTLTSGTVVAYYQ